MALASNVSKVTVTGQYVDYLGQPIAGSIRFEISETLRNAIADQIIVPSAITVNLDTEGAFSVVLPVTNDPDLSSSFSYGVEEAFAGGRSYRITIPSSVGASANIADLASPDPAPSPVYTPYYAPAWNSEFPTRVENLEDNYFNGVFHDDITGYVELKTWYPTYADLVDATTTYADQDQASVDPEVAADLVAALVATATSATNAANLATSRIAQAQATLAAEASQLSTVNPLLLMGV